MFSSMENPADAARATAHTFGFTTWNRIASKNVNGRSRCCAVARDALISFQESKRIQSAGITLIVNSIMGAANRTLCTPKTLAAARSPVPIGTPNRCGRVAQNPNRAPDVVSSTTFGPGENSPANMNTKRGSEAAMIVKIRLRSGLVFFPQPAP